MVLDIGSFFGYFIGAFIALITIMNPFSTASIFLTITQHNTKKERLQTAKKACTTAAIVLVIFALGGTLLLKFFSVTVDAFRIAGGLLITHVGNGMLQSHRPYKRDLHEDEAIAKEDVSLIPLAIPMLSGPGAMTTVIVLMSQANAEFTNWSFIASLILAIVVVSVVSYIILSQSIRLQTYIGHNEQLVIEKIMGLVVLVIGIQFFINGVVGVLSGVFS